jgi:hypothetical protein
MTTNGSDIDWQTVETLVDSERAPIYAAALSEAVARRDALQQRLFAVMDQCALLRFKLGETVKREKAYPDLKNLDQRRKYNREAQQRCRARKQTAQPICIE